MNDTSPRTEAPHEEGQREQPGARSDRVRSLTSAQRTSDGMVCGVAAGIAHHLDIDPVLVRVAFGVLTFVGGAGVILYLACWFLLPAAATGRSVAAEWFGLERHEESVRVVGLGIAAAIAVLSVIGDGGWGPGFGPGWLAWTVFWVAVPIIGIYYLVAVLPRQRRVSAAAATMAPPTASAPGATAPGVPTPPGPGAPGPRTATSAGTTEHTAVLPGAPSDPHGPARTSVAPPPPPRPRRHWSPVLGIVTFATIAVAMGTLALVHLIGGTTIEWTTYLATALGITGLGILAGTRWGDGLWMALPAVLMAAVLAVGSTVPNLQIEQRHVEPTAVANVPSETRLGAGQQWIDLTRVDPDELAGHTLTVQQGAGEIRIEVPEGVRVRVEARVRAGSMRILDEERGGVGQGLKVGPTGSDVLTLDLQLGFGEIRVVRS